MKRLISILAVTALCACETNTVLDERAVEHNIALENAKNKIALLNVVRSAERLPMTFSRLGSLKYTTARGPGTTWDAPLGGLADNAAKLTFTPAINDSNVADFDALNGEEFYKSILASVDPEIVKYYRDRGFPDQIVFSLFIERIEFEAEKVCYGGTKKITEHKDKCTKDENPIAYGILGSESFGTIRDISYGQNASLSVSPVERKKLEESENYKFTVTNDPDDPHEYLLFRQVMNQVGHNYTVSLESEDDEYVKWFKIEQFAKLRDVALPEDAVLRPHEIPPLLGQKPTYGPSDGIFYKKKKGKQFLRFKPSVQGELSGYSNLIVANQSDEDLIFEDTNNNGKIDTDERKTKIDKNSREKTLNIVFRSPASILYYLGEIQRAQTDEQIVADYKELCSDSDFWLREQTMSNKEVRKSGWDGSYKVVQDNKETHKFTQEVNAYNFRIGMLNPCSSEYWMKPKNRGDGYSISTDEPFFHIESEPFDRARVSQTRHDLDYYGFEYQGRYYWVSRDADKRGRTMQNITLVNELFDQKQKASKAPQVTVLQGRTF